MTADDLAAIAELEKDADGPLRPFPSVSTRVKWLCTYVKRLEGVETPPDDRDAVLATQAARIAELEGRLKLTPERVLSLERAELKARDDKRKPKEEPAAPESTPAVGLDLIPDLTTRNVMMTPGRMPVAADTSDK